MFKSSSLLRRIVCAAGVFCAFLLMVSPRLLAQSTSDGAIAGTVTDPSGAAVPNATVTVTNNGTNVSQTMTTDESGYFRAAKLPPASYVLTVEAPGPAPYTAESVSCRPLEESSFR